MYYYKHNHILLVLLVVFLYLYFPSFVLAVNYGSGLYDSGLYSSVIPSVIAIPSTGSYNTSQQVTLNTEDGNLIRYSSNATPSNCSSGILYINPIEVSTSQTIYTRSCDSFGNSSTANFVYIILTEQHTSNSNHSSNSRSVSTNFQNEQQAPVLTNTTTIDTVPLISNLVFTHNLKLKAKGNEVKLLQKYLINNKYLSGYPDGDFGPNTQAAVIKFQKDHNLLADGIVGLKTIEIMQHSIVLNNDDISLGYIFSKNLKLGLKDIDSNEIYQLQKYLNNHGYIIVSKGPGSLGNENHYFGSLTKKALTMFQLANNLVPDGIFGLKTRELINKIK